MTQFVNKEEMLNREQSLEGHTSRDSIQLSFFRAKVNGRCGGNQRLALDGRSLGLLKKIQFQIYIVVSKKL
jgi:hypothetical protein